MTLLQIHEPGETPLPHSDEVAVGIDLGTTHSVVAFATTGGQPTVLHDICGGTLVPSVVQYDKNGTVKVGKQAVSAMNEGGANIIRSVKRLMGRGLADAKTIAGAQAYPFDESVAGGMVRLKVADRILTPVEISADILHYLKEQAEKAIGKTVTRAVITVPAYFDDAARMATRDAARLAGLEVLRLLNEPTSAALAYGLDKNAEGIYAVYDLGGGTFDLSLLKLEKGVFRVLAAGGDITLGGDDFDVEIARDLLNEYGLRAENLSRDVFNRLLSKAREAKETLSSKPDAVLTFTHDGKNLHFDLSSLEFEALIAPYAQRTLDICENVLRDAHLTAQEVKGVVLVGGSTRIPFIRAEVQRFFGKPPLTDVNPDEVVAVGAALQAQALTRGSDNLLLDVTPLSLGLEIMGGMIEKIIYRNTPIPVAVSQEFTTYQDNQTGMIIHVLQGEREMVDQCRSLARFELTGIPPQIAGMARIKITFAVDADGLLQVSAKELTTGVEQGITVKPSYGLSEEEMHRMLEESMRFAKDDIQQRLLVEARTEAERIILELESAMKQTPEALIAGEREAFAQQVKRLKAAMAGTERDQIDYEAGQFAAVTRAFAERRMNRAVQNALQGQKVDDYAANQ